MLNQETSNINGEIETWRRAFDGESMKESIPTVCTLWWQINLIVLSLPPRTFFLNCTLVDGYKTPSPESHLSLSAGSGQVVGQSRLAKELSGQEVLCQMQRE